MSDHSGMYITTVIRTHESACTYITTTIRTHGSALVEEKFLKSEILLCKN